MAVLGKSEASCSIRIADNFKWDFKMKYYSRFSLINWTRVALCGVVAGAGVASKIPRVASVWFLIYPAIYLEHLSQLSPKSIPPLLE